MCHLVPPTNEVSYLLKPKGPAYNSSTVRGPGKPSIFYISKKRPLCSRIGSTAKGLITQSSDSDPTMDSHFGHSLGSRLLESPSFIFLICSGFPSPCHFERLTGSVLSSLFCLYSFPSQSYLPTFKYYEYAEDSQKFV